ncbi:xanthine dehydrogenase family protein subunit M [Sphingosinicella sp.]|uniref:FAD binding domain-containing protein n=1 Tax=Sphingosinicella sp. TaxID=1917971 RepID=UPI001838A495|nr:xanthine dehydrogenase family protein subunit M [Sphingosinicella sp.]MBA4760110.1 xanthine dehydrogenase family protein subunit M [Sphingosinicella sp.]
MTGYYRPSSLAEAATFLGGGGDVACLAGGHTLIPAMKSRLRAPDALVDLAHVPGLSGISREGDRVWIGAMTCHADVAKAAPIPALARLAGGIGDPQVRERGTLGGSVANNDPAADYPAAVLALDAVIETNRGTHAAGDFFLGMFTTALEDAEIITRIGFRVPQGAAYAKFAHPASRYALVGVFVARFAEGARVTVTGAGPGVFRWTDAEVALDTGGALPALAPDNLNSDIHAGAEYRAHLAGVMLRRAQGDMA